MIKRKLIQSAAHAINENLLNAERNCEGMIANLANIALTISNTRESAGLPIHHGQEALARVADTFAAITTARAEVIKLHDGLAAENKSLGEPLKLTGDVGKPPQAVPELIPLAA